jgi:hypothetical protein
MRTFTFAWTAKLGAAIGKAAPKAGYHMSLVAEDRNKVIAAVNQGIDAYLEAHSLPGRTAGIGAITRPADSVCFWPFWSYCFCWAGFDMDNGAT